MGGYDVVPKGIDDGSAGGSTGIAILVNVLLAALFAIQHPIMARPGFEAWWTKLIAPAAES